jgi:tripartite-type tricarboxylate transporter receptor subunit TctC
MSRKASLILLAAVGLVLAGSPVPAAETYPSRPVKLIVPFAAGGPLDLVVRALGDKLAVRLKQPFIVENRPGAGGNIGTEAAAKASPDGYTLLAVLSGTLTANPALYGKLPFAAETDFQPISLLTITSQMLVVHPSVPVNSVAEFVASAKREPIAYAHAGPGSGGHLAMEYFRLMAGFDAVQVPYRGNAPLVIDLVAGQVKTGFVASAGVIPHVRERRLRGLAISSAKRSPLAPEVPTTAEAGYPDLKLNTYFVLLAPAKTPDTVTALIEREIKAALQSAELQDKFRAHDIEPLGTTPAQAKALLRAETELWADIVRKGNLRLN